MGLALELPDESIVDQVTYTVTGNGVNFTDTVDVTDPNSTLSVEIGLPEGEGYSITMSATTSTGAECVGSATFDILAGMTTSVNVSLFCTDDDLGGAIINGTFVPDDGCPAIAYYAVAPLQTSVGSTIAVSAAATPSVEPVAFSWAASSGSFTDPSAPATTYTCTEAGSALLTLSVQQAPACEASASVTVSCVSTTDEDAGAGGAGGTDAGPSDDAGAGGSAPEDAGAGGAAGEEAGSGGSAGDGAGGQGPTTESTVGTWLTPELSFDTTIQAPVVGTADLGVTLTLAMRVSETGVLTSQVCEMSFDETALGLEFIDSVQEIQSVEPIQLASTEYSVGDAFPVESVELAGQALEVNATAVNLEGLDVDLTIPIALDGTFSSSGVVTGTTSFSTSGTAYAGVIPLGAISIPAPGDPIPQGDFSSVQVSDDPTLSCAEAAALL